VARVSKSGFPIFCLLLRNTNIKPFPHSSIFFELDTPDVRWMMHGYWGIMALLYGDEQTLLFSLARLRAAALTS